MNFKRAIAAFVVFCLILICTGCGVKGWQNGESAPSSSEVEVEELIKEVDDSSYENNLSGLSGYLKEAGAISGEAKEMSADMIGAIAGEKYEDNVTSIEIYEFSNENLSDTAKEVIRSIKETGKFEMLGIKVDAVLSENEKFLMVYSENKADPNLKGEVEKAFVAFKKG